MPHSRLPALALLAAMFAAGLPGAAFAAYGAIAYSPADGASAGSWSAATRAAAENRAMELCEENGDDCRIASWFKSSCGALAVGSSGGWASRRGGNRAAAERAALTACSGYDDGCRIRRWGCSG